VVVEKVTDGVGRCAPDLNRWKTDIAAFQPLAYDQYLPKLRKTTAPHSALSLPDGAQRGQRIATKSALSFNVVWD